MSVKFNLVVTGGVEDRTPVAALHTFAAAQVYVRKLEADGKLDPSYQYAEIYEMEIGTEVSNLVWTYP